MKRKSYWNLYIAATMILLMMLLAPASVLAAENGADAAGAAKVRTCSVSLKPSMHSMKISWEKQKDVSFYRVFCRDVTKDLEKGSAGIPLKKYAMVAKISGKKTSFTDRTLVEGNSYAYVIQGYARSGGKTRLVCSSYSRDAVNSDTVGLAKPELLNGGGGEFFTNGTRQVYLHVQSTGGVEPTGFIAWRRAEGEKEFQKVRLSLVEEGDPDDSFNGSGTLTDTSVAAGIAYEYKICTTLRKLAKRYVSPQSDIVRIPVVEFTGKFDVESLTETGDIETMTETGSEEPIELKLTSHLGNGKLVFRPNAGGYESIRIEGKDYEFKAIVTQVSRDGESWTEIPAEGAALEPGETLFLRIVLAPDQGEDPFYSRYANMILDENVDYDGPGVGYTNLVIAGETAEVYQNFD